MTDCDSACDQGTCLCYEEDNYDPRSLEEQMWDNEPTLGELGLTAISSSASEQLQETVQSWVDSYPHKDALKAAAEALEGGWDLIAVPPSTARERVETVVNSLMRGQESILLEAERITNGQRQRDYGDAKTNHARIAALWSAYIDYRPGNIGSVPIDLTEEEVATMMILVKVARLQASRTRDSLVDIAGYSNVISKIWEQDAKN